MKATVIQLIIVALLVDQVKSLCHEHCQWCRDDVCQECRHNLYLYNGTCVDECPPGHFGKEVRETYILPTKKCSPNFNGGIIAWGRSWYGGNAPELINVKTVFSIAHSIFVRWFVDHCLWYLVPNCGGIVGSIFLYFVD